MYSSALAARSDKSSSIFFPSRSRIIVKAVRALAAAACILGHTTSVSVGCSSVTNQSLIRADVSAKVASPSEKIRFLTSVNACFPASKAAKSIRMAGVSLDNSVTVTKTSVLPRCITSFNWRRNPSSRAAYVLGMRILNSANR